MTNLELASRIDYATCVAGAVLIVVGMLTWIKSRSHLVQYLFSLIGLCMLGIIGNYATRVESHTLGEVLSSSSVHYLHVLINIVVVLAIGAAGLEHLHKK